MLFAIQLFQLQPLHVVQVGQLVGRFVVVFLFVFQNFVDLQESVKAHHRAAQPEVIRLPGLRADRGNLRRGHIKNRWSHLRSHKPLPDEPVELQLLLGKVARNRLWRTRRIGRPNRFVRILRGFLALVHIRRRGQVPGSQLLADPLARPFDRLRRHARRIRSHVSNKAGCSLGAHLDAFIKPLRHAHRAAHIEAQLAGRVPLQLAGDERRLRPSLLLCGLHRSQRPLRLVERRNHRLHRLLIRQRIGNKLIFSVLVLARGYPRRLAVDTDKARLELFLRLLFRVELGVKRPILHRPKRANLPLPLHDQPHGHGLHAPSRQAPPHFIPQQR